MKNEQKILKEIFTIHKRKLKHLNVKHEKLLICFSGIPCTGKTHLAKILENKYQGIRISTDELRKIIKKLGRKKYPQLLDKTYKEKILHEYLSYLIEKWTFKNKLVLLDKGIDRDYEKISDKAKKAKFKLFIIRIVATKKIAKKGVILKLGKPDKNFIENINLWVKEFKQFDKTHKVDLTIKNDILHHLKTKKIFEKLDKLVK